MHCILEEVAAKLDSSTVEEVGSLGDSFRVTMNEYE